MLNKVVAPNKIIDIMSTKHFIGRTIVIFDWDDTLLASTALANANITLQSAFMLRSIHEQLGILEDTIIKLFDTIMAKQCKICIITNSESGWIEYSAQKFMPRVYQYLNKINIISARSTYQLFYPGNMKKWKLSAFTDYITTALGTTIDLNIISFGDSEIERDAVLAVGALCKSNHIKSIKFIERPTISHLTKQLMMIVINFENIMRFDHNMDMMLTISGNEEDVRPSADELIPLPDVLPHVIEPKKQYILKSCA